MPELLLHIGTHKTGTTSIQRFCGANRVELRANGIWYPPATAGRFPDHYAHHRIAHAIAGRDDAFGMDDARRFFKRIGKQIRSDEKCLISAEPFYRHMLAEPGSEGVRLTPEVRHRRFEQYVDAVRECVDGFDVTVMVMVRRQDLFAESLYAEQILASGYNRSVEQFVEERHALLDYAARVGVWAGAFGADRVSLRSFESSVLVHPIERVFVEWLGLEWSNAYSIGSKHNVTPPRALVEFKRMMNSRKQGVETNNVYRRWVERLAEQIEPDDVPDLGRYYLQPRDRVALLERYADGNAALARRFGESDELFVESVSHVLAQYVDRKNLSERQFRAVARKLFAMVAEDHLAE